MEDTGEQHLPGHRGEAEGGVLGGHGSCPLACSASMEVIGDAGICMCVYSNFAGLLHVARDDRVQYFKGP